MGTATKPQLLQSLLRVPASAKPKIYAQVVEASKIDSLTYWLEIFFSAGIATFGLVESSPAVIIGAMLISPLMGPIMATGLSLAVGDLYLGVKAVLNLVASIVVSIALSGFLVWLLPFHSATAEIVARTNPNLLDLGIALFSGLAGSVVVCRGGGEGATALPGVAIAVALMPPLCTMGFGLGSGVKTEIMGGAGLLFLTNLVAIVASAFVIFLLVQVRTPEVEKLVLASPGDEPLARFLSHRGLARIMATGGQLRWRILMILILLGAIAVPLRRALLQVANETLTRTTVQEDLKRLIPSGGVVSQQVTVGKDDIAIRLVSTHAIPDSRVKDVRDDLMRRTGRRVDVSVEVVASQSALATLMERLTAAAPLAPKEKSFAEMQKDLLDRLRPALEDVWPSSDAPIQDFDVVLGTNGPAVEVHYQAPKDLGDVPLNMVLRSLRTKLDMPDMVLNAERIKPAPPPKGPRGVSKR